MEKVLENDLSDKKILVVHQQFAANKMRELIKNKYECSVDVGTFFKLFGEFAEAMGMKVQKTVMEVIL